MCVFFHEGKKERPQREREKKPYTFHVKICAFVCAVVVGFLFCTNERQRKLAKQNAAAAVCVCVCALTTHCHTNYIIFPIFLPLLFKQI